MPIPTPEEEAEMCENGFDRLYATIIDIKEYVTKNRNACDLDHIVKIVDDNT